MKNKDGRKTDSSTLDALLKLLPMLALNYPGLASMLGQLSGDTPASTGQMQEALPKITKRLAEMDPNTKEELAQQLLSFFPELGEILRGHIG